MTVQNQNQSQQSLEVLWRLARVWRKKGNLSLAVNYYRQILAISPSKQDVFVELIAVLTEQGDWQTLMDACRDWLAVFPDHATHNYSNTVHKLYIDTLIQQDGIAAAFDAYQLTRQDHGTIEITDSDLLCCAVMRNEAQRVPYFLDYYRQQGVTKFLIVDNNSTDETLAYLLTQSDVYVWHSTASYKKTNCGAAWWELLLRRYGVGHWVLVVDADELLYYPMCEERTLVDLCEELEAEGKSAYKAIMLDMYGSQSIQETHYTKGTDFLTAAPYFDRQFYHLKCPFDGPFENMTNYWGGVRTRVFGGSNSGFLLNKVPLFIYREDDVLCSGQHWIQRPLDKISAQRGALLHFKYFSSFHSYVKQEIIRKEHARQAAVYKQYAEQLADDEALTLYDPLHSIQLENSAQLMKLGIIRAGNQASAQPSVSTIDYFPSIRPLPSITSRPFWSVMIAVDEHSQAMEHTLRSVVSQLPVEEEAQIEIVCGQTSPHVISELNDIVDQIGDERLRIYQSSRYLGRPTLLTHCIERAHGQWVHILTGGDWLSPGFYNALRLGIERAPEIGAAFCRFDYDACKKNVLDVQNADAQRVCATLESTTAGILTDWLPRIAVQERVAFSAMVVKRAIYESIGGFCLSTVSAATWEMCQRVAHHCPVWYEPQTFAHAARNPFAINFQRSPYGMPLAHAHLAIDIASSYLSDELGEGIAVQAHSAVAAQAVAIAQTCLEQGLYRSALANLGEGLRADALQSREVNQRLLALFSQIVS